MPRHSRPTAPARTRTRAVTLATATAALTLLTGCGLSPLSTAAPGARPEATTSVDAAAPGAGAGAGAGAGSGATASARPRTTLTTPAQAASALAQLGRLPVKGRAPKTGYDREQFGPAWTDDVDVAGGHNGCDTRNDVLRRDLTAVQLKPGRHACIVLSGALADPYTGRTIAFVRGASTSSKVQIDHVVALGDAWVKGAQRLTHEQRTTLANDPLNLLAVDGPTNGAKRDSDAATWLPPNKAFRCTYVARQVAVKARYRLWVTAAEKAQIARQLESCRRGGPTA